MIESREQTWAPNELEEVPRCPICADARRDLLHENLADRHFGTTGRWTLARCSGCRTAYLDPRPQARVIGRAYERYYTHESGAAQQRRLGGLRTRARHGYVNAAMGYSLRPSLPFARALTALVPRRRRTARLMMRDLPFRPGGRLLDIGCGNGDFVADMSAAGWAAEGVDPDPRAVLVARSRGLVVHQGTVESVQLPAAGFDAITLSHVFEHLPHPVSTLAVCNRLLAPGGVLWLAMPNIESRGHRTYGPDWLGLDAPRHLVLPPASALGRALRAAGFTFRFLPTLNSGWNLLESERLRAERLRAPGSMRRRTGVRLLGWATDLRSRWDPVVGEDLVALATRAVEPPGTELAETVRAP